MSLKTELAKVRQQIEERVASTRPREIYRMITTFEGEALTDAQQAALDYNRSLKNPAKVGFVRIHIAPQPSREPDPLGPEPENDLAN